MTTWYVQRGSKVQEIDDATLRELLRRRSLSGMEAARRRGDESWAPLHEFEVFRRAVPHRGNPALAARTRQAVGFAMHLAVYVIVACIIGFNPWVLAFWGLALATHAVRSAPALRDLFRHHVRGLPLGSPGSPVLPAEDASPPSTGYMAELEEALEALSAALESSSGPPLDAAALDDIRARARALHEQRTSLQEVANDGAMAHLEAELMEARHHAENAADDRTAAAYEAEARAIVGRLQTMKDAAAAADGLRARERTLLHELEGVRLQLLRAGVSEEASPALEARLARVKGELRAEAEVDATLAEARLVAAPATGGAAAAGPPSGKGGAAAARSAARQPEESR